MRSQVVLGEGRRPGPYGLSRPIVPINVKFTRTVCRAATVTVDLVNTDTVTRGPRCNCTQMTAGLP